jgi:signal transduction histidine kinase
MISRFWSRLRLAPRIAAVMVLTVVTTLLVLQAWRNLSPPPGVVFLERAWLVRATLEAERAASAVPAERRLETLSALPSAKWLNFEIASQAPPPRQNNIPDLLGAMRQQIAEGLGGDAGRVLVATAEFRGEGGIRGRQIPIVVLLVTEIPLRVSNIFSESAQTIMTTDLRIGVALNDGSWLVVSQNGGDAREPNHLRGMAFLICGALAIGGLSIWMARSLIKPLTQLAGAAERLGRERETTPIARLGMPEYDVIAKSFNEMQLRLKRFVDERMHMLAAISHDLRTPLTRLRLFAEYIPDRDQRRQVLQDIADMEVMVSSSLTFASDEIRREPHSPVDIATLLISLCDTFTDAGGQAAYDGPDHAPLSCRPVAMRRAFANLIDNGCKYGERVCVSLRNEADAITVTIQDSGPGIPAADIERAFAPFQRLEGSRNRETGGTGLGLTIARDVILGHGGDITLSPAHPNGLVVTVHLPKLKQPPKGGC